MSEVTRQGAVELCDQLIVNVSTVCPSCLEAFVWLSCKVESVMQDLTDASGRNAASNLLDTLLQHTDWYYFLFPLINLKMILIAQ